VHDAIVDIVVKRTTIYFIDHNPGSIRSILADDAEVTVMKSAKDIEVTGERLVHYLPYPPRTRESNCFKCACTWVAYPIGDIIMFISDEYLRFSTGEVEF